MGLRVKICGITRADQAQAIVQLGATALGFICAPSSPRYVTPAQIRDIVTALQSPAGQSPVGRTHDRIGVFVNASLDTICNTVQIGNLSGVQLHGNESPEFCQQLRVALPQIELIKALRVRSPETLETAIDYAACVDALLLDAYHPTLAGGTGQTLDWEQLRQWRSPAPWFLSGGLTPDNVLGALGQVQPNGIDLSSGVERAPGDKNLRSVARLFEQLATV